MHRNRLITHIVIVVTMALILLAFPAAATAQPSFLKTFNSDTIGPGSVSTLIFEINNTSGSPVSDLAFVDVLPAGVTMATPAMPATTCGGTLTASDGAGTITFIEGVIAPSSVCQITVDVTSSTLGTHTNVSGDLTSSAGNSGTATADLVVATDRPGFSKSFAHSSLPFGGRSTLTFTIDNSANPNQAFSARFTDPLPAGMVVADPANETTTCTGGTLTAIPGTQLISYIDGSTGAMSTCSVAVDVTASSFGVLENTTSDLTILSLQTFTTVPCGKANAELDVTAGAIALVKKFTDDPVPPGGTVTLEFTIFNRDRGLTATGLGFTDNLSFATLPLIPAGLPLADPCGAGSSLDGTGTLTLTGGSVAPESFCTFSVTLQVDANETVGAYINETSAITGTVGAMPVTGNIASDVLFVSPSPVLTKTFAGPAGAGGSVNLSFVITNSSSTSAATDIAFTDVFDDIIRTASAWPTSDCGGTVSFAPHFDPPQSETVPATLTLSGGSLAAGASCTIDIALNVLTGAAAGTYPNTTSMITATVDGVTFAGVPASDDLLVIGAPSLTKEFLNDPVQPGGTVTLEFTLLHDEFAQGDATAVAFTDNLAATIAGLSATGLPLADLCGAGNGNLVGSAGDTFLTLSGVTLTPGQLCSFSVTLDVPAGATPGRHNNTTSDISATVSGVPALGNAASDDLNIGGLVLSKEFTTDPVLPGGSVDLLFTIENTTVIDDATAISFQDNLDLTVNNLAVDPASLPVEPCGAGSQVILLTSNTLMIMTGGNLLAGEQCSFTLSLDVPAATPSDSYLNTTTNFQATIGGSTTIFDNATDTLVVEDHYLVLSKEFTDDPVPPGATVTLHFTMTNLDPVNPASDIAFTDDLDAALTGLAATGLPMGVCGGTIDGTGELTYSGGSLAAGETCQFDITLDVPSTVTLGTIATNITSDISGTIGGLSVTGGPATDDLRIDFLEFSKNFDAVTIANGTPVLTFTITNLAATDSVSDLAFSDDLNAVIPGLVATNLPIDPCGAGSIVSGTSFLTMTGGSLPPGGMCSFDVELLVPATATPGAFLNTTSDLYLSGLPSAQPATATLTVEPPPAFNKAFTPSTIIATGTSTLSFTINNTASTLGPNNLDFTDNLPAGLVIAMPTNASTTCTGGILTAVAGTGVIAYTGGAVNAAASCTVQVDIVSSFDGIFINTTGDLTSSSGNSGTASATLTVTPATDLVITKIDDHDPVVAGTDLIYTVTVTNIGPSDAQGVTVTDTLPADVTFVSTTGCAEDANGIPVCTLGSLAAGANTQYTVTVTVNGEVANGSILTNTATVSAETTLINTADDTAAEETTVSSGADLELFKVDAVDPIGAGMDIVYTLTVTNHGPTSANNVLVTDTLPAGVTLVSTSGCAEDPAGIPSCSLGTVASGASVNFDVTLSVTGASSGTITNTASVSANESDPDLTNNDAEEDTTLDLEPPLVTAIDTVITTPDSMLEECETTTMPVREVVIIFSESVLDPPGHSDPDDVSNPDNYRILSQGPNMSFDTVACGVVFGDDIAETIDSVEYDDMSHTARLVLANDLGAGQHRLFVCGSTTIYDLVGNPLDGTGDGNGGDDFALGFRVDPGNLFSNGDFDCDGSDWTRISTIPEEIEYSSEDMDNSADSGSMHIVNLTASTDFEIAQCVATVPGVTHMLNSSLRIDAAPGIYLSFTQYCEFYSQANCAGTNLLGLQQIQILNDTAGMWGPISGGLAAPGGAYSAQCGFSLSTGQGADFDAWLDGLALKTSDSVIFNDGFESGNSSAWSSTAGK